MKKVGLVLEGGAFRGIFTAGVLDCLMDQGIKFPYVVGVSAGSGNAISYISGQRGRTKKVITHENADPYFGLKPLIKSGKLLNLDTMLYTYCYEQIPFDFDAFFASGIRSEYVSVCCEDGRPAYFNAENDPERLLQICKATCSVPFACSPVEIDGRHYLDGSVADAVPFERAFEMGCDRAVVILTRKEGDKATDYSKVRFIADVCYKKKYPQLYDTLMRRSERYEQQMEAMLDRERAGQLFVIRPTQDSIGHFEGDKAKVEAYYRHGYSRMVKLLPELRDFTGVAQESAEQVVG